MKITDLHIHGFGVFAEQELSGLSSGVNVFLGNNEAGKSTCLSFLRYMLFGLPRKGKNISHHEPLRGGNHSGVLGLDTDKFGAVRLERSFKPKRLSLSGADGSQLNESVLQALLGNVSRELYTNVYGFSLTELQSKDALTGDAVRNALYGTVHGGASYTDVVKRLAAKREALFKKGGKVPPLNKHLKELEQMRKDMNASEDSVAAYLTVSQQIAELESELAERAAELRDMGITAGTVTADIRLWSVFTEYKEKKATLEAVQPLQPFPQDGLVRFEACDAAYKEKQEQQRLLVQDIKSAKRDIEEKQSQINAELLQQQDVVRALSEEKAVFISKENELEQLLLKKKSLQRDIAAIFEQLGTDWNAERIKDFDLSDNTRREVAQLEEQVDAAKHTVALAQNETARLTGVFEDAQRTVEQRTYEFEQNADVVRFTRSKGSQDSAKVDLQKTKEILRSVRSRLPMALAKAHGATQPAILVPAVVGGVGAVITLLSFFDSASSGMTYAGIGILLLAVAGAFWGMKQQKSQQTSQQDELITLMRSASYIFPNPEISEVCLLQAEDLFEDMQRGVMAYEALQDKVRQAQKDYESAEEQLEKAKRNEQDADEILTAAHAKVEEWLSERGVSTSLRVQHIPETLQLIKDAKLTLRQISDFEARKSSIQDSLNAFAKQQDAVCASSGIEPEYTFDKTIKRDITQDKLLRILTESESAQVAVRTLSETLQKDVASAKALQESLVTLREEIGELFSIAKAKDENSFREAHAVYTKQQDLLSSYETLTASLIAASEDGDIAKLAARIGQQSQQELEVTASELTASIEIKEREQEELRQKLIQAKVEQEKLTSMEEQAQQRAQSEALKEEANGFAKDWARYRITEHLLSRARERFEREQQPEVVKQAGKFFQTITKGAYSGVFKPLGEESIFALAQDGTRREPEELSRGTVEQLYLSLRLGHILRHSQQNEPLPVIMDDIMVNFDPTRAKSTAETIAELAKHNQVFLFTCHPQTVDLMQEYAENPAVFTVQNGMLGAATS
ncbi:AAA family ATPase [Halodesulfovibrio sp.]|jgi:uncharacterized protein YhaN|uniref:ATP-binding protein n=1 Tax=Halodesulfovibrio sp. TaxID=1912772 RepID=UPI0025E128A0|nr:AAA family ATPase [Halodesulfovibrio sp.]MCT4535056.1 AAA family ATPase [Halodesulfovibrio sp.]